MDNNSDKYNIYIPDEKIQKQPPAPIADRTYFVFNDMKKGQSKTGSFVIRNIGGKYENMELFVADDEKFIEILKTCPLEQKQTESLPLKITFKAQALDWSRSYTNTIVIKLDSVEERVTIDIDTQTKPVNDFAEIFTEAQVKKMTALIERLEKATTAEIAVVTVDGLEGKSIEQYTNELFNEWGIGKETLDNGVLFLIDPADRVFRIEVGKGLEKAIPDSFISGLFTEYAVKYFRQNNFGKGSYLILSELFAEIYRYYKNT